MIQRGAKRRKQTVSAPCYRLDWRSLLHLSNEVRENKSEWQFSSFLCLLFHANSSPFFSTFAIVILTSAPPPPVTVPESRHKEEAEISFRVGILWLFVITLAVSAMSDILVDTIEGFAKQVHLSEVFTSMVILPFFSNVAEQVSAIIFAYRNEMDLVVGVTVGSAIQVAAFVLPGCVIIGWMVDRSMTLYFHAYETTCLFLAVIVVAAFLQGGTTNWLVGATCMSVYFMIATGFWFHSLEDLSVDAETFGLNETRSLFYIAE